MAVNAGGGGVSRVFRELKGFLSSIFQESLNNFFHMKDRGGVVFYIRIALEKGFSDMYG